MSCKLAVVLLLLHSGCVAVCDQSSLFFSSSGQQANNQLVPVVINTWPFTNATYAAWKALQVGLSAEEALLAGVSTCEREQCDGSVGYGNHPDDTGETTLDAMIMDGASMRVGAVGDLRRVREAVAVASAVMHHTDHTLLVGEAATQFAKEMGFKEQSLSTPASQAAFEKWKEGGCQPNYRQNVTPDPRHSCGPYKPVNSAGHSPRPAAGPGNHDTIGMVAIDSKARLWAATSTNGMDHKVAGRVGDSPIAGAGAYVDERVGGAAATGDGDVMMRFLPSLRAVLAMSAGASPAAAARAALRDIVARVPDFSGALVALNTTGHHGAACHGFGHFGYSVASAQFPGVTVITVPCD